MQDSKNLSQRKQSKNDSFREQTPESYISRIVQLVDSMPEPRCNLRKRKDHNTLVKDGKYAPEVKRRKVSTGSRGIEGLVSQIVTGEKRTKERSLEDIVEKVAKWRELYAGVIEVYNDGTENFIEYTLEDAAKIVGISKKSLDDYLL